MKRKSILALVSFFLLLGGLASHPGHIGLAQTDVTLRMSAKAGYGGQYKEGFWYPVRVTLENNGQDLEGQVQVRPADIGDNANLFTYAITLPATSKKEITLYVFPQGYTGELEVSFVSGKKSLQRVKVKIAQIPHNDSLYGIVASSGTAFNVLVQVSPSSNIAHLAMLDLRELPDRPAALSGFNLLIFSNVDTGALSQGQRQALWSWVESGGQLVITGGAEWKKTTAGFEASRLPLTPTGTKIVTDLNEIETFANTNFPLDAATDGVVVADGALAEGAQTVITGKVGSSQDSVPLVLRQPAGAGEVIFLAFDPADMPFKAWDGRQDFYTKLLFTNQDLPSWSSGLRNWSQAKEAAQTLHRLSLPSTTLICGSLFLYLLIIGPFNFLVLRALKRRELGWITTPALVVSISAAVMLFGAFSRGSRPVLNQAAVIQSWEGMPEARIDGVVGIYSPTRSTYQADASYPFLLHPLPEDSLIPSKSYTTQQTGEAFTIPQVQVDISGITPLAFEGTIPALQISQDLVLNLGKDGAVLQGKVINQSQVTLEGAVLLAPGASSRIGSLKPGESATLSVPLLSSQKISGAAPALVFQSPAGAGKPLPPPGIAGSPDTTIQEILGTNNFYDTRENYRRYSLISAAMNSNDQPSSSRGAGFYLVGWSSTIPDIIHLANQPYETEDTAVYFIALNPRLEIGSEATLTPGLYTWQVIEGTDYNVSPYSVWLYNGMTYSLEFKPILSFDFPIIKSLTLHLETPGTSGKVSGLDVSLWDFQNSVWVPFRGLKWGDNLIPEPESLVSQDGRLRLRLQAGPTTNLQITRSDFTLVAGR